MSDFFEKLKKEEPYTEYTLDMFSRSAGKDASEIKQFNNWRKMVSNAGKYTFEVPHLGAQKPEITIQRENGDKYDLISFSSYNYLGYSYHPDVIQAGKDALDKYGLGATGSPLLNGTFQVHKELEKSIVDFYGLDGYGATLFSSGYGVSLGVISAFIHKNDYVICDRSSHACIFDGAILSQGKISLFKHNDAEHLEKVIKRIDYENSRILVCCEGVYSTDGDYGNLKDIVSVAKKYGAAVLVDEAHSLLLAGENGKGVCEHYDVIEDVDMIVATFSKSFGGVGGCLYAKKELTNYMNYYARSRMFSCALDPAVTGGLVKAVELAGSSDGYNKRKRIIENSDYLRSLLREKVDIGTSTTWIIPIIYGDERLTLPVSDYLQKEGIDISLMTFPAVSKNRSRIRAFVTSEHTKNQLDKAAEIILKAGKKYNFLKES